MTPDRKHPTRQEIKEGRPAQQAADELAREADRMEQQSDHLGAEIDEARSDWERKRADPNVAGANPPASEEGAPKEAAYPAKDADDETEGEGAGES
jgi:hypothetical protein